MIGIENLLILIKNLFFGLFSLKMFPILAAPLIVSYFSSKLPTRWVRYTVALFGSLLLQLFIFILVFHGFDVKGWESLSVLFLFVVFILPYSMLLSLLVTFFIERRKKT